MEANELIVRQALAKYAATVEALPMDKHAHLRADAAYADAMGVLLSLVAPNSAGPAGGVTKRVAGKVCRVCGCTEFDCRGCIERTGSPCRWVADDLCSACEDSPKGSADNLDKLSAELDDEAETDRRFPPDGSPPVSGVPGVETPPVASLRTWACAGGCGVELVLHDGERCVGCEKRFIESQCAVCDERRIPDSEFCRQHERTHCNVPRCPDDHAHGSPFCESHAHECVHGCRRRVPCEGGSCFSCQSHDPPLEPPTCTPELVARAATHVDGCTCVACSAVAEAARNSETGQLRDAVCLSPPGEVVESHRPDCSCAACFSRKARNTRQAVERGRLTPEAAKVLDEMPVEYPPKKLAAVATTPADRDRATKCAESRCAKSGCLDERLGSYLFCSAHQREEND